MTISIGGVIPIASDAGAVWALVVDRLAGSHLLALPLRVPGENGEGAVPVNMTEGPCAGNWVVSWREPVVADAREVCAAACQLDRRQLELIMRSQIMEKVEQFHDLFHHQEEFIVDNTPVSYAGRVYGAAEMKALVDSSLDFWLTYGRYSRQFERDLAKYLGMKYAVLTNSGSSANLLAVSALTSYRLGEARLGPGDEVLTVAAGFPTTVAPIVQNRLVPVFVDVELGTYNINPALIEPAIGPRTRAIMLAHTLGNPFNLDAVTAIARKHNLWLIEDNCDALGSTYRGRLTGTFGDVGTSSFYPAHHITIGEGGAIYTSDPQIKLAIESFRDWGRDCWCDPGCDNTCGQRFSWQFGNLPPGYDHKYTYTHIGYNLKVTDMQAAIGVEQLRRLPAFGQARRRNFTRLHAQLKDLEEYLILPRPTDHADPSWFGFPLTIRDGAPFALQELVTALEGHRIQTRRLFAGNILRQPAFMDINHRVAGSLAVTDKVMTDTFLVGVYPGLNDETVDFVADRLRSCVLQLVQRQRAPHRAAP